MIPLQVINRGTDNDIANTVTTQRRIAGCGHCMALGAEKDQMEGRCSSGLGSIQDKNSRSLSEIWAQWYGRQTMCGVNGDYST